jgi:distribution and morphology protein 12
MDWIDGEDHRLHNTDNSTTTTTTAAPAPPPPLPSAPVPPSPSAQPDSTSTQMDFQAHLLISYKGDMSMTILTELRMNYPSMIFMSLPIQLKVRSVEFEATALVAYIQSMKRVCVSMLEADDEELVSLRGKSAVGLER